MFDYSIEFTLLALFLAAVTIYGTKGIHEAYKTGRGIITLRAKADIEENKKLISVILLDLNKN